MRHFLSPHRGKIRCQVNDSPRDQYALGFQTKLDGAQDAIGYLQMLMIKDWLEACCLLCVARMSRVEAAQMVLTGPLFDKPCSKVNYKGWQHRGWI